jgi:hypothetical protein
MATRERDMTPTEVHFQKPLTDRQAMQLLLLAGYYGGVQVIVDSRDRIIGMSGPRWAIDDMKAS